MITFDSFISDLLSAQFFSTMDLSVQILATKEIGYNETDRVKNYSVSQGDWEKVLKIKEAYQNKQVRTFTILFTTQRDLPVVEINIWLIDIPHEYEED